MLAGGPQRVSVQPIALQQGGAGQEWGFPRRVPRSFIRRFLGRFLRRFLRLLPKEPTMKLSKEVPEELSGAV